MASKVAIVTGANTGIGLALAERLLQRDENLHICLACRNKQKAEAAAKALKLGRPNAKITILLVDISKLESVYMAAEQIKKMYKHVDYLYLNAGIMPSPTVNWGAFWEGLFSKRCVHMFTTGDGLLQIVDSTNSDGLKQIFATNLFGHFVLIKELQAVMGGPTGNSQIIWTSSSNAKKEAFEFDDLQHEKGIEPYSSSKYASDLISVALNEKLNKQGIFSHVTCPGLVMTNLTYGILPSWFWLLVMPLLWLLRLFTGSVTVSPFNGSEALFWLSQQRPESLDPMSKFHSRVSVLGNRYTYAGKMPLNVGLARKTFDKLAEMEETFRRTFKS